MNRDTPSVPDTPASRPAPQAGAAPVAPALSPSTSLLSGLRRQVSEHAPFSMMGTAQVDEFLASCEQRYFAPDDTVLEPASGPVTHLYYIRQGAVVGERGLAELSGGAFHYEAGDLFPVGAAMGGRPVTARYRAVGDLFVLALPVQAMRALSARSAPFADYLNGRIQQFVELSRKALQVAYSSQTLAEQSLETPLGQVARRAPVTCRPATALRDALTQMHQMRIGSMLVTDEAGVPQGILTRDDVLGRVTLPGTPLDTPISQVMVQPVVSLSTEHTAQDAAMLMSRRSIRHVPVTRDGVAVGIVSERDLFALQRLSLKQVSGAIQAAPDVDTLRIVAQDIRRFARSLLGQGVQARQLTGLISHLNDVLTQRLLDLLAERAGLPHHQACWLALGSEGRAEQTIATDQDNALILPDGTDDAQRARWLALAREANQALDACGYPLCKGGIMAGNEALCLTLAQWRERFAHWMEFGSPQDLLNANVFFDFRALWGQADLAQALRAEVGAVARRTPRFLKLLADNARERQPPLNWMGGIDTDSQGGLDLKLQGTAIVVDAARLYALAHGIGATGTRERIEAAGPAMGVPANEYQGWVTGFEFLQMLRLRLQLDSATLADNPNHVVLDSLNDIDRRILKSTLRIIRSLQQRMEMDWTR